MSDFISTGLDIEMPSVAHNRQWKTCLSIAVALHLAILSIPISKLGGYQDGAKREIEVSVLSEPPVVPVPVAKPIAPPVPRPFQSPKIEKIKNTPPSRPEGKKSAEEPQKIVSPDLNPVKEVNQVGPGSGGVAIAGAKGTGATLSGSAGEPGGSGAGLGRQGAGGGAGPIDAQFGAGDGPQWVYQEKPVYPYAAQRLGKKGRVVLKLTIDEKGNLTKTEVLEATDQIFVSSVLDAVRKSKFHPARKNGVPFATRATWPVTFNLGDRS